MKAGAMIPIYRSNNPHSIESTLLEESAMLPTPGPNVTRRMWMLALGGLILVLSLALFVWANTTTLPSIQTRHSSYHSSRLEADNTQSMTEYR